MRTLLFIFIYLCLVLNPSLGMADERHHEEDMDLKAMMEAYQKLSAPGDPHKQLMSLEGSWTTHTKEWTDPSQPPKESTGSCEMKMLLGGRFLQQTCSGEMMGQPFSGIGISGYDNIAKKYVSTWMDSMATGIFIMTGATSVDGKTITLHGEHEAPNGGHMKHRAEWTITDKDHQTFIMYGTHPESKEAKIMEITYSRK